MTGFSHKREVSNRKSSGDIGRKVRVVGLKSLSEGTKAPPARGLTYRVEEGPLSMGKRYGTPAVTFHRSPSIEHPSPLDAEQGLRPGTDQSLSRRLCGHGPCQRYAVLHNPLKAMVGGAGLEPATPCL